MTGTVLSTCTRTPAASQSAVRAVGSQQFEWISRNIRPSFHKRARHAAQCSMLTQPGYPYLAQRSGQRSGKMCVCRSIIGCSVRAHHTRATLLARAQRGIGPELFHGLREMLHDVLAHKDFVIDKFFALLAEEHQMLRLCLWATTFNHHSQRVWTALRTVRDIGWNEECLTFADWNIADSVDVADANGDVTLELNKKLFAVSHVEIIASVRPSDDHHKEILAAVQVLVPDRRLHHVPVLGDPLHQRDGTGHGAVNVETGGITKLIHRAGGSCRPGIGTTSVRTAAR